MIATDHTTAVILSACRTPIGKYLGGLSPLPAPRLGALVIREAVRRAGIDVAAVEEVIIGNVLQGGVARGPGRVRAREPPEGHGGDGRVPLQGGDDPGRDSREEGPDRGRKG